jgi:very-short-patch-repair endonuclease
MPEYMRERTREEREEDEVRTMLVELGWSNVRIREEEAEAHRRGILFTEWVAAALYIFRSRKKSEGGREYAVEIEREVEYDPCALLVHILRRAGTYGSLILEGLRRFNSDEEACRWLMTPHERLNGRRPRELIHSEHYREVSELFRL